MFRSSLKRSGCYHRYFTKHHCMVVGFSLWYCSSTIVWKQRGIAVDYAASAWVLYESSIFAQLTMLHQQYQYCSSSISISIVWKKHCISVGLVYAASASALHCMKVFTKQHCTSVGSQSSSMVLQQHQYCMKVFTRQHLSSQLVGLCSSSGGDSSSITREAQTLTWIGSHLTHYLHQLELGHICTSVSMSSQMIFHCRFNDIQHPARLS